MNGVAINEDELLEGPALDAKASKVEKQKLRDERDKRGIKEKSFFNNVTDTKETARKGSKLKVKKPKILLLSPHNGSWAKKMMARLHNPLRKEIADVFTMLEVLLLDPKAVRSYHVSLFFQRWDHVCSYLTAEFEGEQHVLFRALTNANIEMPEELSPTRVKAYADLLQELINAMGEAESGVANRPPIEPLMKASKAIEDVTVVLDYLDDVDITIIPRLEQLGNEDVGHKLEREMMLFLSKNGDHPSFNVLLLLNKLDDDEGKWLAKHIFTVGIKIRNTNYRTRFKVLHVRPLKEIVNTLGKSLLAEYSKETEKSPLVTPTTKTQETKIVAKEEE